MSDNTKIEWTDATWNPITGCSVVSPGCTNCYAMQLAGTRLRGHPSRAGLTRQVNGNHVWTGEVRFNESTLTQPLRWKHPRRVFVCAHGDLFHESVPDEWIDRVFAVMALASQHTFQVLTKRSARMREYLAKHDCSVPGDSITAAAFTMNCAVRGYRGSGGTAAWPLPNVWLGVSVEDQARADERIPDLLATPAAVRWISAEPLLGPVDWIKPVAKWQDDTPNAGKAHIAWGAPLINWIVAGGESGRDARPMHPEWARSLRDQCAAAGVPFFFKQWGEWLPYGEIGADGCLNLISRGKHPQYWHDWPTDDGFSVRVGKKRAGRLLDGVEHSEYPGDAD